MSGRLLPPANEVCEGYVFTPVCQSFCSYGGHLPQCMLGYADPPPPGVDPWEQKSPPPQCMLEDTANKRVVRILLECILVAKIHLPFN